MELKRSAWTTKRKILKLEDKTNLFHGDCLEQLKKLPSNSVDSLVTDPPAGISFMQKNWDDDKGGSKEWIDWLSKIMVEVKRVLKPGAHGLVWAIPRTSHWTATALEQAGFEIKDIITHVYGSGFPKSQNISKAIDKQAGVEREVVGVERRVDIRGDAYGSHNPKASDGRDKMMDYEITIPKTDKAKQWDGWGSHLKPASEHWILIKKPIAEDSIAENVIKWGVGGINIDESRVGVEARFNSPAKPAKGTFNCSFDNEYRGKEVKGRFPANFIISHHPECEYKGVKEVGSGDLSNNNKSAGFQDQYVGGKVKKNPDHVIGNYGTETVEDYNCHPDCPVKKLDEMFQGVSRFFYCPKPSKDEKNRGLEDQEKKGVYRFGGGLGVRGERAENPDGPSSYDQNFHPTVKSTKLMSYLTKMVNPPKGLVIDPFMGSGSTGIAALKMGGRFVGIEKEKEYFDIAEKRLKRVWA